MSSTFIIFKSDFLEGTGNSTQLWSFSFAKVQMICALNVSKTHPPKYLHKYTCNTFKMILVYILRFVHTYYRKGHN